MFSEACIKNTIVMFRAVKAGVRKSLNKVLYYNHDKRCFDLQFSVYIFLFHEIQRTAVNERE